MTAAKFRVPEPGFFILVLGLATAVFTTAYAKAEEIHATAKIIAGDTLKMADRTIHLFGVDAPDIEQKCRIYRLNWPCGQRAIVTLELLIANKPVRCRFVRKSDKSSTTPEQAHCYNFENVNLNSAIIGAGMAVPYLSQSRRYVAAGQHAQLKRLGLWSGRFIMPKAWRQGKRFRPLGQPFKRKPLKD